MKITRITVYQVDLPLHEGEFLPRHTPVRAGIIFIIITLE